jgi:hypothetical protein
MTLTSLVKKYGQVKNPPVNRRSKAEVVAIWEARNQLHIVVPDLEVCLDECVCSTCFNTRLDKLLNSSEEALGKASDVNA